ncbi:MAG: DUF924 family protein [Vulcanimicrobiota bacterium]
MKELLEFWFGTQFEHGFPVQSRYLELWFRATPAHDWAIYRRFDRLVARALDGQLEDWATSAEGRLALILLLDQLPRHLFRHTAFAYRGDKAALGHCREAMRSGQDRQLLPCQRLFLYAPLEHSEDLAVQEEAVENIQRLQAELDPPAAQKLEYFARWIRIHRDVVARFGRFPWRNRALGRDNSLDEETYLTRNPPYLGQW